MKNILTKYGRIFLVLFILLCATTNSFSAENNNSNKRANRLTDRPEGLKSKAQHEIDVLFETQNVGKDGMTLSQYKSKKLGSLERRQKRREIRKGTYLSPEEKFKLMDKDEDGIVTREELEEYINLVKARGENFY